MVNRPLQVLRPLAVDAIRVGARQVVLDPGPVLRGSLAGVDRQQLAADFYVTFVGSQGLASIQGIVLPVDLPGGSLLGVTKVEGVRF